MDGVENADGSSAGGFDIGSPFVLGIEGEAGFMKLSGAGYARDDQTEVPGPAAQHTGAAVASVFLKLSPAA